jgi:hypothetical protein
MLLAKEYGCLPQDIENMDAYWLDRMILLMNAESSYRIPTNRVPKEKEAINGEH